VPRDNRAELENYWRARADTVLANLDSTCIEASWLILYDRNAANDAYAMTEARKALARCQAAWLARDRMENEARRKSIPAGWYRIDFDQMRPRR